MRIGKNNYNKPAQALRLLILCAAAVILVAAGIWTTLHPPRPLHEQIADYMYHSCTDPKLKYCIEKYGDEFVATKYGSIFSTRFPNFYVRLDWSEEEQTYQDNYIVYLRQEELTASFPSSEYQPPPAVQISNCPPPLEALCSCASSLI